MINETTNLSSPVAAKDANGNDVQVAYLNATLDSTNQNFSINMNVTNKALMTATTTNVAGDTVQTQYSAFETAVKNRAKELGYIIFA